MPKIVDHELQRERKDTALTELVITPEHLAELVDLVEDGTLSSRLAKDVFGTMLTDPRGAREIVKAQGL